MTRAKQPGLSSRSWRPRLTVKLLGAEAPVSRTEAAPPSRAGVSPSRPRGCVAAARASFQPGLAPVNLLRRVSNPAEPDVHTAGSVQTRPPAKPPDTAQGTPADRPPERRDSSLPVP